MGNKMGSDLLIDIYGPRSISMFIPLINAVDDMSAVLALRCSSENDLLTVHLRNNAPASDIEFKWK